MNRGKFLLLLLVLGTTTVFAQKGSVRGFVYDKQDGEPVIFTNILLEGTKYGAATDVNGYFVISNVPYGNYVAVIRYIGYTEQRLNVHISDKPVHLKIELEPATQMLSTVTIDAKREQSQTQSNVSVEKISPKEIQAFPSIGGQADIAQYLQVLPGVVFSGDQGGQLYIRGGSAIQNKVLLDGMVIYNPFHSIGLFSVFETEIIRNADVYSGGFNAQYGGRISSIMDITTKDGNKKHTSGKISASTFGANLLLEGPVIKESENKPYSFSYILSAKNSYLSYTSKNIYSYIDGSLPYDFFDIYGKATLATSNGSKLNVFGFNFTDDVRGYKSIADFNWKNRGVGANFVLLPGTSPALIEGVFAYSDYTMSMTESNTSKTSAIGSFNGGLSITNFFGKNQLKFGLELIGNTTFMVNNNYDTLDPNYSTEIATYSVFKGFLGKLLYEPSIRFIYYASLGEVNLEPRLSFKLNLTDNFRLKFATGMYSQTFIDTKSDRDIVNLFTGYLTASEELNIVRTFKNDSINQYLEKSNHFIFGIEWDLMRNFSLNAEVYYKMMNQLVSINRDRYYNDDFDHSNKPDYLKKEYILEDGRAYGGDISLKYDDGRLYLWAIYSLGWVKRENEIQIYYPHYDRRHNLNILSSYQFGLSRSWEVSLRWNYGSGFPYTPTSGMGENLPLSDGIYSDIIVTNGSLMTYYGELNSKRLPDYHRLDFSLKKRWQVGKRGVIEATVSVTNVYNRNNMFYYDRITGSRVDQLPIMPSIGLNFSF
ncbi:MAG: TonB-dependent receptor [Bacteroidales bacterium]|jgi:hypothetical protein|nr:TonB-dependent receptor [Bacteroidales bacterium]